MSSANVIRDGFPGGNRRSYISTDTFTSRFYSYTTRTIDGVTTGIFDQVTNDDSKCPKGRILRENGRKLFPGANPNVTQYFVGVYDAKTFLNGFIDPNSRVYSSFNTDKSYYVDNDLDSDHGSVGSGDSGGEDLGDPVYTRGMIETISGDILANPNGGENFISLRNDISGSRAYFGFNDDTAPYVCVETDGASGYMQTSPTTTDIYLEAPEQAAIYLDVDGTNVGHARILASDTQSKIELDISGATQVSAYASNGSIFNTGLLHPHRACGEVTLGASGFPNGSYDVVIDADIPLTNGSTLVFLSRKTNSGFIGTLGYSFSGQTLQIRSTDNRETTTVDYLIISSSATRPTV